jgi:predicted CoA-substrate-specific enzyme activase
MKQTPLSHLMPAPLLPTANPEHHKSKQWVAGIDVGSRTTKVVILNSGNILAGTVLDTGIDAGKTAEAALMRARQKAGISKGRPRAVVGTGYGRVSLSFLDKTATELTCHARGCHFINPEIRTVIDIGGQDSKVVHLDADGSMVDFVMNDKCAAGTGKFLEMVARTLELDLTDMADMQSDAVQACTINSMCAVFAETEVVSLLAKKKAPQDIVSGINRAFATRIGNMVKRLGVKRPLAFVGGVAKNKGLANALVDYLGVAFTSLDIDPQLTGALGAAVLAQQSQKLPTKDDQRDV